MKLYIILATVIDSLYMYYILDILWYFIRFSISNQVIFYIFLFASTVGLILVKDYYGKNQSLGKLFTYIYICDSMQNDVYNWKIILLRNIINLLLFPITFVTILFANKTLGDIICKTQLVRNTNKEPKRFVVDIKDTNDKIVKYIIFSVILTLFFSLLMIYLLLQPVNYFSLRVLIVIFIIIMYYFAKFFRKKIKYKHERINYIMYNSRMTIIGCAVLFIPISSFLRIEKYMNFKNVEESVKYGSPTAEIIYTKTVDSNDFVLYHDNIGDNICRTQYNNNGWTFCIPQNNIFTLDFIINKNVKFEYFEVIYNSVEENDEYMVVIKSKEDIVVSDKYESEFEIVNYNGYNYYATIIETVERDYWIIVNDTQYDFELESMFSFSHNYR